jgi:hypothetical protein
MNLMRSLCCLFSNRCGCDAGEERRPQTDTSSAVPSDADIAPEKLSGAQLMKPTIPMAAKRFQNLRYVLEVLTRVKHSCTLDQEQPLLAILTY